MDPKASLTYAPQIYKKHITHSIHFFLSLTLSLFRLYQPFTSYISSVYHLQPPSSTPSVSKTPINIDLGEYKKIIQFSFHCSKNYISVVYFFASQQLTLRLLTLHMHLNVCHLERKKRSRSVTYKIMNNIRSITTIYQPAINNIVSHNL